MKEITQVPGFINDSKTLVIRNSSIQGLLLECSFIKAFCNEIVNDY